MPSLNRLVMQKSSRRWLNQLGPSDLDAAEISGSWGRNLGWHSYDSLHYPKFDICTAPLYAPGGDIKTFDVILANQVWEHLERPYAATRHVYDMLRPKGWFWLAVPFFIPFHKVPVDCSRWSAQGLRNLLIESGFAPETIQAQQWGNRAAALRNMEPEWPPQHLPDDDLTNDPEFPLVAWAMGQKL